MATLGGVTLPPFVLSEALLRERHEQTYKVRTPGGRLRVQVLSPTYLYYSYQLSFKFASMATYTALEVVLDANRDANSFPTFVYDKFPSAVAGVTVDAELGPWEKALPDAVDDEAIHFTLNLTESEGR